MRRYAPGRDDEVTSLHDERLEKIVQVLRQHRAETVLDLGCGSGELLARLALEPSFRKIVGLDISLEALSTARDLLQRLGQSADGRRLSLCHASFTDASDEFSGFDAGVMLETLEHIDPQRLSSLEKAVFSGFRPSLVIVTTPNREYNVLHGLPPGALRHRDHRFEWDRAKFRQWATGVAGRNEYQVAFDTVGPVDPFYGSSTQMASFSCL
ncbi:methyltransferase domain-containing protein [Desulfuromonas sp. AOP6]|uniref:methyltransferase domain-containing protein n=1 Tax=Desulfuromonas sp. AOP6 TaxID=1566351 RepID=UPI0012728879|nr:methyltransferase domain-containing protein [Desulfuromonas sp. AOP6]BCA79908.1 hypothetical protein AOP6_1695 [Desulfuromonas sp. AOP6]